MLVEFTIKEGLKRGVVVGDERAKNLDSQWRLLDIARPYHSSCGGSEGEAFVGVGHEANLGCLRDDEVECCGWVISSKNDVVHERVDLNVREAGRRLDKDALQAEAEVSWTKHVALSDAALGLDSDNGSLVEKEKVRAFAIHFPPQWHEAAQGWIHLYKGANVLAGDAVEGVGEVDCGEGLWCGVVADSVTHRVNDFFGTSFVHGKLVWSKQFLQEWSDPLECHSACYSSNGFADGDGPHLPWCLGDSNQAAGTEKGLDVRRHFVVEDVADHFEQIAASSLVAEGCTQQFFRPARGAWCFRTARPRYGQVELGVVESVPAVHSVVMGALWWLSFWVEVPQEGDNVNVIVKGHLLLE